MTTKLPSRADHVGSFLRPRSVIEARDKLAWGDLDAAGLRAIEDEAIAELTRWQESLGLKAITDGEFRRYFFHTDFLLQLAGVEERGGLQKAFKNDTGKDVHFAPPVMVVTGKIEHVTPIQLADYQFLAANVSETPKVTIPSPTMLHFRAGRSGIPEDVYPEMEGFYADVAKAYCAEVDSLAAAGCRYIQMDDTNLAYLCDDEQRADAARRGLDPDATTRQYAKLINDSFASAPADMLKAIHLCRGNFRSSSRRCGSCPRARPSCWAWSPPSLATWRRRTRSSAGSRKRPNMPTSTSWRSARSAVLPARSTATTSPPNSRQPRSAYAWKWRKKSGADGAG